MDAVVVGTNAALLACTAEDDVFASSEAKKQNLKAYADAHSFGGWKALVYRLDGTVDVHMSMSAWPDSEKLLIYKEMVTGLVRQEEESRKRFIADAVKLSENIRSQKEILNEQEMQISELMAFKHEHRNCSKNKKDLNQSIVKHKEFSIMKKTIKNFIEKLSQICNWNSEALPPGIEDTIKKNPNASQLAPATADLSPTGGPTGLISVAGDVKVNSGSVTLVRMKGTKPVSDQDCDKARRRLQTQHYGNVGALWLKMEKSARKKNALAILHGMHKPTVDIPMVTGEKCTVSSDTIERDAKQIAQQTEQSRTDRHPDASRRASLDSELVADDVSVDVDGAKEEVTDETKSLLEQLQQLYNDVIARVLFSNSVSEIQDTVYYGNKLISISETLIPDKIRSTLPPTVLARAESINKVINHHLKEARRNELHLRGALERDDEKMKQEAEAYYANFIQLSSAPFNIVEFAQRYPEGSGSPMALKLSKSSTTQISRERRSSENLSSGKVLDSSSPSIQQETVAFLSRPEFRPKSAPNKQQTPTLRLRP